MAKIAYLHLINENRTEQQIKYLAYITTDSTDNNKNKKREKEKTLMYSSL